jgi:CHAD domain
LPSAVKRIAVDQIDLALCYLDGSSSDLNHSIHATRQSLKRLRALVALMRYELGEEVFKREWSCFRRAGRLLAGARDAAVIADAFDSLTNHFSSELNADAFTAKRSFLIERLTNRIKTSIDNDGIFEQARELLTSARQRVPTYRQTWKGDYRDTGIRQ